MATSPTAWALLGTAIVSEVTASLSLKGALDRPALYGVVAVGYLASFTLLALVLRRGMPLGVAYGVWGALGVALTAVASSLVFDEALTGLMGLGIVLIIAGVLTVELGSQRAARERARATGGPS
ncbi:DMT family transporter [Terracoccus luteus]|uniref:Small multidrug resistance pump n=1 Tax=Terracoccus luteus TaxID=53356 RepID=A0A495Y126_9MICO|nr:SMR family transporter [Terracoccus luteus]MBB2985083.1 small multidrug resistance pump [Terracoccus luteus]MCP2170735.1 small multidrug resistance pump [Terracoccus luteus]RKT77658.1 small multidrug resistance pump [Terracoccus luteus]